MKGPFLWSWEPVCFLFQLEINFWKNLHTHNHNFWKMAIRYIILQVTVFTCYPWFGFVVQIDSETCFSCFTNEGFPSLVAVPWAACVQSYGNYNRGVAPQGVSLESLDLKDKPCFFPTNGPETSYQGPKSNRKVTPKYRWKRLPPGNLGFPVIWSFFFRKGSKTWVYSDINIWISFYTSSGLFKCNEFKCTSTETCSSVPLVKSVVKYLDGSSKPQLEGKSDTGQNSHPNPGSMAPDLLHLALCTPLEFT